MVLDHYRDAGVLNVTWRCATELCSPAGTTTSTMKTFLASSRYRMVRREQEILSHHLCGNNNRRSLGGLTQNKTGWVQWLCFSSEKTLGSLFSSHQLGSATSSSTAEMQGRKYLCSLVRTSEYQKISPVLNFSPYLLRTLRPGRWALPRKGHQAKPVSSMATPHCCRLLSWLGVKYKRH
jgi:hypothetical protein